MVMWLPRDQAKGTADYSHQHPLSEAVADAILPVFESLSDRQLLSRCLHGGTQNRNEAIKLCTYLAESDQGNTFWSSGDRIGSIFGCQ